MSPEHKALLDKLFTDLYDGQIPWQKAFGDRLNYLNLSHPIEKWLIRLGYELSEEITMVAKEVLSE